MTLGRPRELHITSLDAPQLYLNRELSQLAFNQRVFEQARDPRVPLLERLRFLTICSSNLDEFFEVRVAGLKQQVAYGIDEPGSDGLSPSETLTQIGEVAHSLVAEQYRLLNEELVPELEREGVHILHARARDDRLDAWVERYFQEEVLPVIAPMALDPARPFPRTLNKSLNLFVEVEGRDAFDRVGRIALVQVPRSLPRLIAVPAGIARAAHEFVTLSSVVRAHVGALFSGMRVAACSPFRVTRNSELWIDEEEVEDLLSALRGELSSRNYGDAVRLEVAADFDVERARFLLDGFHLEERDLYHVPGPVNLNRLSAVYEMIDRPDLKYPAFVPRWPGGLSPEADIFEVVRERDVLLHHPFELFRPIVDLVRASASDPDVLAIKMTFYRTDADSPFVPALEEASRNGKDVTVVVELRARFDEAENLDLATRLQESGAKVVYGIVGYKCHAKMLLIVRREEDGLRRYVHLGTGNYHTGTARSYTDIGLLTSDPQVGEDVHSVFLQVSSFGQPADLAKLIHSPFTLQRTMTERIAFEAAEACAGRPARIVAKMNSLSDPVMVRALYRASQAGVEIDLIVRGICCLRPGVPGVSENIRVKSVVGRFLEHSRIYWFNAAGESLVYASSADWMERNLYRRVETGFAVEDRALADRIVEEILAAYVADDRQSWLLSADGSYTRVASGQGERSAQAQLLGDTD